MKELIRKYCLQNAVFHGGTANPGAVVGKVMASEPSLRPKAAEVRKAVEEICKEINKLSPKDQALELERIDPSMLVKEEKKQEDLPPLKGAEEGKVVTRFAPSPTGPLNITHLLRAVMLNYMYSRKYKGKFILRFEDTDIEKIKKEYYVMIREDLKSVGIKPDKEIIQSERMDLYYSAVEELIRKAGAYMCSCPAEAFRDLKLKKQDCPCRDRSPNENLSIFNECREGKHKAGSFVLRLKTSMKDPNPAIRDPPIMRINHERHPLQGTRYKVWPLYNFANVVDDHDLGITHVFRGKEHEHNTSIQKIMYDSFDWKMPIVINFGMMYLPGEKLHTRDIKEMISQGKVSGWDDPKLHTVRALLKRGIVPEAFRQFSITCGLSKCDIRIGWENLYGINKKLVDKKADRYMVVTNPIKVDISVILAKEKIMPGESWTIKRHPDRNDSRNIPLTKSIFVSGEDFKKNKGKDTRLLELWNIRLDKKAALSDDQRYGQGSSVKSMIHWVPEENVRVKIISPEGETFGLGDPGLQSAKVGDIIQMVRMGFGRIDKNTREEITVYFAHK